MKEHPDRAQITRGGDPGHYFYHRPGEVLVVGASQAAVEGVVGPGRGRRLRGDARLSQRQAKRARHGTPFGVWLYSFDKDRPVEDVLRALRSRNVKAHYNYVSSRTPMRSHAVSYAEPADPTTIDPPLKQGRKVVRVGVLDTGRPIPARRRVARHGVDVDSIFVSHPPTAGTQPPPDRDTMVMNDGRLTHPHAGHGLFVASIIARHAPNAEILAEATMYQDSIADLFEILVDLEDAITQRCKLLNMSLGFRTEDDQCPVALDVALGQLEQNEVLLVASAGNDGTAREMWPAADPRVVAVAATDSYRDPTDWSTYGSWVDACAFGNDVDSHYPNDTRWAFPDESVKTFKGAARWSGTSFAAPLVTARIANEMAKGASSRAAWDKVKTGAPQEPGYGVYVR